MAGGSKMKPQRVGFYQYHEVILGKGNFATVYLARHKVIGCDVALKVINVDDIEEEYVSRNLHREARILHDLHHPNIIRLYETVRSVNLYCLSLELIRGINLYQYMKKQSDHRISEKMARIFFYQMLSAVEYMHRLNIIHRDLKQENILVESGHVIKIVDFGLSNVYYPCHRPRTHCGSVEYAAPELFRSHSVYGTGADLWSLGVILYAMVVGEMPFKFSREITDCPESTLKRELFVQRISKGLMQENWELMEDLSPDCWNLLHDLLQPDQFRRIRIEDAIAHHWITKDVHLRKRLPQRRRDLQKKFHSEILGYLAHRLNTSVSRVEKHINASHEDKVQCMYYVVRDTLVKDVLYPPKEFEASFLYRFDQWKKSQILIFEKNPDHEEYEEPNLESNGCGTPEKPSYSFDISKEKVTSKTSSENNKTIINQVKKMEKKIPKEESHTFDSVKSVDLVKDNTEVVSNEEKRVSVTPYRSYKNSRPEKVKALQLKEKDAKESDYFEVNKSNEKKHELPHDRNMQLNHSVSAEQKSEIIPKKILLPNAKNTNIQIKSKSAEKPNVFPNNTSKCRNVATGKQVIAKAQVKSASSIKYSTVEFKNTELKRNRQFVTPKKTVRNSNQTEKTPKTGQSGVILLSRKQKFANVSDNSTEVKKIIPPETPRRILVNNMHYGPPAPFTRAADLDKARKSKRTSVADRMSFCRGDTHENY